MLVDVLDVRAQVLSYPYERHNRRFCIRGHAATNEFAGPAPE